jgi:hypothetical protein
MKPLMPCVWVLTVLLAAPATAQSREGAVDFLYEHLTISQSLDDLNSVNKPARLYLTRADDTDESRHSWQKDVAVAVSLFRRRQSPNPPFNYGIGLQFGEANGSKRRNAFQLAGLQTEVNRDISELTFVKVTAPFALKRDGEKHTRGFAAKAYLSLNHKKPPTFTEPYAGLPLSDFLEWTPQAGLEYDNVIAAEKAVDEGYVLRTMEGISADFYPFAHSIIKRRVVASAKLAHRYDATTDFTLTTRHHRFADLSAAIGLDSDRKILVLVVERVMGEDPSNNVSGPFWRVGLAVHFAKPQARAYFAARDRVVVR